MTARESDPAAGATSQPANSSGDSWQPPRSDSGFFWGLGILASLYVVLILAMLGADVAYAASEADDVVATLWTAEIRFSVWLSLISCSITAILSMFVAVPLGYLLSRIEFRGKAWLDGILDIPIFLPPLVIGLSLLILFRQTPLRALDDAWPIALHVPAVILAQFAVATAFAIRAMQSTFDEISPRQEQVALTLGCSRSEAFWLVVMPAAWRGLLTAFTLSWARAFGEFGPILVFAGSTRMRTEVLPVSVHLELSIGNIEGAIGVSIMMVVVALAVLGVVRWIGSYGIAHRGFDK